MCVDSALLREVQSLPTSCGIACEIMKVARHKGWQVACRDDWDTIFIQTRQLFDAQNIQRPTGEALRPLFRQDKEEA
jgi:hypothetical protein